MEKDYAVPGAKLNKWRREFYEQREDWDERRMQLEMVYYLNEIRLSQRSIKSSVTALLYLYLIPLIIGVVYWIVEST